MFPSLDYKFHEGRDHAYLPIPGTVSKQWVSVEWPHKDLSGKAKFLATLKSYYQWPKDSKVPSAKWNIFMQSEMILWMSQYLGFSSEPSHFKLLTCTEEVGNGHDEKEEEGWVWLGSWIGKRECDRGRKLLLSPGVSQQVHGRVPEWKKS